LRVLDSVWKLRANNKNEMELWIEMIKQQVKNETNIKINVFSFNLIYKKKGKDEDNLKFNPVYLFFLNLKLFFY